MRAVLAAPSTTGARKMQMSVVMSAVATGIPTPPAGKRDVPVTIRVAPILPPFTIQGVTKLTRLLKNSMKKSLVLCSPSLAIGASFYTRIFEKVSRAGIACSEEYHDTLKNYYFIDSPLLTGLVTVLQVW